MSCSGQNVRSAQGTRKIERPRPLRARLGSDALPSTTASLFDATKMQPRERNYAAELEEFSACLREYGVSVPPNFDDISDFLKESGAVIEKPLKEKLDKFFCILRDGSRDNRPNEDTRMKMLKVIELRAMGWKLNDDLAEDCSHKFGGESSEPHNAAACQLAGPRQQRAIGPTVPPPPAQQLREPPVSPGSLDKSIDVDWYFPKGEIAAPKPNPGKGNQSLQNWPMKSAGLAEKFETVAKGPADVISQCIVPLAQEMLKKTDDALDSKHDFQKPLLVPNCSAGDFNIGQYVSIVTVGKDVIHIMGHSADLVRTATLVLKDYFSSHLKNSDEVSTNTISPTHKPCAALERLKLSHTCNALGLHAETSLQKAAAPELISAHRSAVSELVAMFGNGGHKMDDAHSPNEQSHMTPATGMQCSDDTEPDLYKGKNEFTALAHGGPHAMWTSADKNDVQVADEVPSLQYEGSSWIPEPSLPSFDHNGIRQCFETKLPCNQGTNETAAHLLKQAPWPNTTRSFSSQAEFETSHDGDMSVQVKGFKNPNSSQQLARFLDDEQVPSAIQTLASTHDSKQGSRANTMKSLTMQTGFKMSDYASAPSLTCGYKTGSLKERSRSLDQDIQKPPPDSLCGMQSRHVRYTKNVLLECGRSPLATQVPTDFPQLDHEVASVILKGHHSKFNSKAKNLRF